MIPLSRQAVERISTAQESFLPEDVESVRANELLSQKFPATEYSGIVIVLTNTSGGNIVNREIFDMIAQIREWVLENIYFASSISDYFSIINEIFEYTLSMYNIMLSIFNLTDEIIWGIPYSFSVKWDELYSEIGSIEETDSQTFILVNESATERILVIFETYSSYFSNFLSEKEILNLTQLYIYGFYQAWLYARNSEYNETIMPPKYRARIAANVITKLLVQNVTDYVSEYDPDFSQLISLIGNMLDVYSWNKIDELIDVILEYLKEDYITVSNAEKPFLERIYKKLLGRNMTIDDYLWGIYEGSYIPVMFPKSVYLTVRSGYISADNDTMIISVNVNASEGVPSDEVIKQPINNLKSFLKTLENDDLKIYTTGLLPFHLESSLGAKEDVERIDIVTFSVAFILLLIIFRGLPAAIMPMILMGATVIISRVLVVYIADLTGLQISDITLTLSTTAIIGAGVDYTIFLLSRYSEERRKGRRKEDAITSVVKHAGKSVLLSGGTVMIAFGTLTLSSFKLLKNVGLGVMTGIGVALFVALTLTPSTLMIFGDKLFWPSKIKKERNRGQDKFSLYLRKMSKWTADNGLLVILIALIVTLPAIYIYFSLGTTYDVMDLARKGSMAKEGYLILRDEIGSQAFSNIEIIALYEKPVNFIVNDTINITALELYVKPIVMKLMNIEGVKWVKSAYNPYLTFINNTKGLDRALSFFSAQTSFISRDGLSTRFLVSIHADPYSKEAFRIVEDIRKALAEISSSKINGLGVEFYVGGLSANYRDIAYIVGMDFRFLTIVVIIGIILLLMIALRSVLIPLRLEITILLSIVWAVAISMLFWQFAESLKLAWFIPLFLFTVLNGLGMDYDVFLVTRIEEEKFERGLGDKEAIVEAVVATGKIITAAGIIMASAFGSLLIALSPPTQQIGFALAMGVLIDAMIVRIILVPAIMVIAGKWNWWPRIKRGGYS